MIDQSSQERASPDQRQLRLVDGAPPPSVVAEPAAAQTPAERNGHGKKGRKKGERDGLTKKAAKRDKKHGHRKGARFRDRVGAELADLATSLDRLRDRLNDLGSVQLGHAESNLSLARRVEDLAGNALADAQRRGHLEGRLDALTAVLRGLGPDGLGSDQGRRLAALDERVIRTETALAALNASLLPPGRADRPLDQLAGLTHSLRRALDDQAERLQRLEQGARHTIEATPLDGEAGIEQVRAELGQRISALAERLESLRAQTPRQVGAEDASIGRRRARLGLVLGAIALPLALVTATLLGAAWWRSQGEASRIAARLQTLEAGLASQAATPKSTQSPSYPEDLIERLRRLETGGSETGRALAEGRAAGEALSRRLAEVAGAQQTLLQRLDALQRDSLGVDRRLAALDARVNGGTGTTAGAARDAPSTPPVKLQTDQYAIQLVAYTSRTRIHPFVDRYGLRGRAVAVETGVSGRPGYAVVLAGYASEAEARAAIAGLGPGLRALGPWVRRLPPDVHLESID